MPTAPQAAVLAMLLVESAAPAWAHHGMSIPPTPDDFHLGEGLMHPHAAVDDDTARRVGAEHGFAPSVIHEASAIEVMFELHKAGVQSVDKGFEGGGPYVIPGWVAERGLQSSGQTQRVADLLQRMGPDAWTARDGSDETNHVTSLYLGAVAAQGLRIRQGFMPWKAHPDEPMKRRSAPIPKTWAI